MGNFEDLPSDILLDIITRLPTESILDCKVVCRPWRNLVSYHQSFSQLHLTHLHSLDSGKSTFLLLDVLRCRLQYFEYNESDETPTHSIRSIKPTSTPPFRYSIIGSFNGLVCLHQSRGPFYVSYCIWNPMTREYVMLPEIKRDGWSHRSSGFGYLPLTNEYKVVHVWKGEFNSIEVAVYTLGSGKGWRSVGRFQHGVSVYGAFAKGSLYWIDGQRVVVFDLTEEKFLEHLSPPPMKPDGAWLHSVGELGGVLYCTRNYRVSYHIWLLRDKNDNLDMKGQVEHEPLGWNKEFILRRKPLAYTKSGGVLCFGLGSLCIYDPIASTSKKLVDVSSSCGIIPHRNTLVSLKELGEEDTKTMELT